VRLFRRAQPTAIVLASEREARILYEINIETQISGHLAHDEASIARSRSINAGAVWADNAEAVAPHDPQRKISHDHVVAVSFGDAFRHCDEPAGLVSAGRSSRCAAR
jgi:hypothetical protein